MHLGKQGNFVHKVVDKQGIREGPKVDTYRNVRSRLPITMGNRDYP